MNVSKVSLLGLVAAVALGVFAEPSVTVTRVAQRYPWNGLVDIDYTVADVPDPFYYAVDFEISGTRDGQPFKVKASTFLHGGPATSNGLNRATWDANADGETFQSRSCNVTAKLRVKPIRSDGDYMIIDLAESTNAALWRISYMSNVADPEATFNTDEYKTSKILLKKVPAGTFLMGTVPGTDDEATIVNKDNGEDPQHEVTISKPFFMGVFKLTDEQYRLITGTNTSYNAQYLKNKPTYHCGSLSKKLLESGNSVLTLLNAKARFMGCEVGIFGLPTEAQWEYACRAGTTTRRFFDEATETLDDYAVSSTWAGVGTKKPNPWGFYDMYGLTFEHVQDETGRYPDKAETDPCHRGGWGIILRGAANSAALSKYRSAARTTGSAASTSGEYAVRLVFTLD